MVMSTFFLAELKRAEGGGGGGGGGGERNAFCRNCVNHATNCL